MATNSRQKGARGERLLRDWLRDTYNDTEARRGQQRKGGEDSPDVDSPLLKMLKIHPEVKWYEECKLTQKGTLNDWLAQASRDAAGDFDPVVFHKWNRSEWYVVFMTRKGNVCIMRAEDFVDERMADHDTEQH